MTVVGTEKYSGRTHIFGVMGASRRRNTIPGFAVMRAINVGNVVEMYSPFLVCRDGKSRPVAYNPNKIRKILMRHLRPGSEVTVKPWPGMEV